MCFFFFNKPFAFCSCHHENYPILAAADSVSDDVCRGVFLAPECGGTYGDGCPYRAEWVVSGGNVRFRIMATTGGTAWTGIGFSDNTMMVGLSPVVPLFRYPLWCEHFVHVG